MPSYSFYGILCSRGALGGRLELPRFKSFAAHLSGTYCSSTAVALGVAAALAAKKLSVYLGLT